MLSYISNAKINLIIRSVALTGLLLLFAVIFYLEPSISNITSATSDSSKQFSNQHLVDRLVEALLPPAQAESSAPKEQEPADAHHEIAAAQQGSAAAQRDIAAAQRDIAAAQQGSVEHVEAENPGAHHDPNTLEEAHSDSNLKHKPQRKRDTHPSLDKKNSVMPTGMIQVPYGVEYKPFGQDPRGSANLTLCSQNLMNYKATEKTSIKLETLPSDFQRKLEALLRRFEAAQCDVIAVQEVLGSKEEEAKNSLRHLATILSIRTGRQFDFIVAPGDQEPSRVGYLVAKDSAEVLNSMAFSKVELPKLSPNEKTRFFVRTPLELQLRTKDKEGRGSKVVTLINLHSKAKRGAQNDPTELKWETYRMEIAEAVRRIVLNRHRGSLFSGKSIIAILGDRNANFDSASAKILDGSLMLKHFTAGGKCRVSKGGQPVCTAGVDPQPSFYSVLTSDPDTKLLPGTHVFQGEYSWLDDILLSLPSLRFAWAAAERAGDYESGAITAFPAASDHALVWTKLNW